MDGIDRLVSGVVHNGMSLDRIDADDLQFITLNQSRSSSHLEMASI